MLTKDKVHEDNINVPGEDESFHYVKNYIFKEDVKEAVEGLMEDAEAEDYWTNNDLLMIRSLVRKHFPAVLEDREK